MLDANKAYIWLHSNMKGVSKLEENVHTKPPTGGGTKKIAAIVIAAVLVIGGAVAAFAFLNKSPKEKYFTAEKNTLDFLQEQFNKRYEPEVKWSDQTKEKPTETTYELSAEYKDPDASAFGASQQAEFINNSSLTVKTGVDHKAKVGTADISADINGLEIGGLRFGLTKDEFTAKLPFFKDTLLVKSKDVPKLLNEMEPGTAKDDCTLDFATFFEQSSIPEKDQEYLKKEYLDYLYNEFPDEAFETTKEDVKINGKDAVKTEKIKMHLTEKQLKEILSKLFDKAAKDKRLKKMITQQTASQCFVTTDEDPYKQFEDSLKDAKKKLNEAKIPNGVTSTIWVKDDLIVKRDFTLAVKDEELAKVRISGTQDLQDEKQTFDYKIKASGDSSSDDQTLTAKAEFSWKDSKAKDTAEIDFEDGKLTYEGNETLKDGKRTFTRVFSAKNGQSNDAYSITWSGDAKYDKNGMKSNHELSANAPDLGGDVLKLFIKKDGKNVKKIELPEKKNVKDLGSMTAEEIEDYFTNEVAPAIESQFGF